MQEAQSGIIEVRDFDSSTVARMLAYMYTGDYDDGKLDGLEAGSAIVKRLEPGVFYYLITAVLL